MNRPEKYALAVQLLGEGHERDYVRQVLGVKEGGLRNILNDPDGSKQRARRERYRGTCVRCGGKTDGSCGYQSCSIHCAACAAIVQHEARYWTEERVIEAIQLWASEHDGRPPLARDWMWAHPDRRFPASTSVYRTSTSPGSPFAKWADAIEAAGFPRPLVGIYGDRQPWSREKIIAALQRWTIEHGRAPSYREWGRTEDGYPHAHIAVYYFGSWSAAKKAAGLGPLRRRRRVAA